MSSIVGGADPAGRGGDMNYQLGELFSGAGAIRLGARFASDKAGGLNMVHAWAVDPDLDGCATYRWNLSGADEQLVICADVPMLDIAELPSADALSVAFSGLELTSAGQEKCYKAGAAPRWVYGLKALVVHQPDWFVAWDGDAVPRKGMQVGLERMLSEMQRAGYRVFPHLYDWSAYGIPQRRQQWVVVGTRQDLGVEYKVPSTDAYTGIDNFAERALAGLPVWATNNEPIRHGAMVAERLKHIPPGHSATTSYLPAGLGLPKRSQSRQAYRRLRPDQPSHPVTGSAGEAVDLYHWAEDRALTNRECARLQTFPDDYVFCGNPKSVRRQIGRSVPVEAARIIFQAVLQSMAQSGNGTLAGSTPRVTRQQEPPPRVTEAPSDQEQEVRSHANPAPDSKKVSLHRNDLFSRILMAPDDMDSLNAVTGYASPAALEQCLTQQSALREEQVHRGARAVPNIRVVIGMTGEGAVTQGQHLQYQELCRRFPDHLRVRYMPPDALVHSKVYVWASGGLPGRAFLGSANFTLRGMGVGQRQQENVMHAVDAQEALDYFNEYWHQSIDCRDSRAAQSVQPDTDDMQSDADEKISAQETGGPPYQAPVPEDVKPPTGSEPAHNFYLYSHSRMRAYNPGGGINWGIPTPKRKRKSIDDAYLAVPTSIVDVDQNKRFFPDPGVPFTVHCDDRKTLTMRLASGDEGKDISTLPRNDELGKYIRGRMGLGPGTYVGVREIRRYRRGHITLTKRTDGTYWLDFAAPAPGAPLDPDLQKLIDRNPDAVEDQFDTGEEPPEDT